MFKMQDRYAEMFAMMGQSFASVEGKLWVLYNHMVVPVGPIKHSYAICRESSRYLLSRFKSALMVRYTGGFEQPAQDAWYALYIDTFSEVSELSSRYRTEIRKGLKRCTAQRIDPEYFLRHGYTIYEQAIKRYDKVYNALGSKSEFQSKYAALQQFQDIQHIWGVFYDNTLIGYMLINLYDRVEAHFSSLKLHADYLRHRPSECLFYHNLQYYLQQHQFEYINASFKSLLHPSALQDFLVRKFAFVRKPLSLGLHFRPTVLFLLRLFSPMRHSFSRSIPSLDALYTLQEIQRSQSTDSI